MPHDHGGTLKGAVLHDLGHAATAGSIFAVVMLLALGWALHTAQAEGTYYFLAASLIGVLAGCIVWPVVQEWRDANEYGFSADGFHDLFTYQPLLGLWLLVALPGLWKLLGLPVLGLAMHFIWTWNTRRYP